MGFVDQVWQLGVVEVSWPFCAGWFVYCRMRCLQLSVSKADRIVDIPFVDPFMGKETTAQPNLG